MIYFLGIGGIGMSALARWCQQQGIAIAGYDRTCTEITRDLEAAGIRISYQDRSDTVPQEFLKESADRLVVYTPAVPADNTIRMTLENLGIPFMKRSEMLGMIAEPYFTVAVAGTHGKTTTCSMIGHLLRHSHKSVTAFIGGITQNYGSNVLLSPQDDQDQIVVVEADEFDRSFLTLSPDVAVVTSMDADHLDVYGQYEQMLTSFKEFLSRVKPGGKVFLNHSVYEKLKDHVPPQVTAYEYGIESGFFKATQVAIENNTFIFDITSPEITMDQLNLNMPGFHNVENAMSAIAVGWSLGLDEKEIRQALASYTGVKRRFEFIINETDLVFIDDYAHHPVEIRALLYSVKKLFPDQRITAIFQPHLFSRTNDFAVEFANSLSLADEVILLDIYPAREKPIPGVTSNIIAKELTVPYQLATMDNLLDTLGEKKHEVVLTIGAGDIDQLVEPIKDQLLKNRATNE